MGLTTNLQAYYAMNNNTNDSTGNYNGTATSITYTTGLINKAAVFNGSSSKIQLATGSLSPMRSSTALSFAFWMKIASSGSHKSGVAASGGNGSGGISITQAGGLTFTWEPTTPSSDRTYTATTSAFSTGWYFIVFTINFIGTPVAQFYVNNVPITTTISTNDVTNGVPNTSTNTTTGDCIGARYVNSFSYSNATVCEFGIWNIALTQSQVSQLYNGGSGQTYPFNTLIFPNTVAYNFSYWLLHSGYYRFTPARKSIIQLINTAALNVTSVSTHNWNQFVNVTGIFWQPYQVYLLTL